ncbi:MAG: hypothetical protein IKM00_09405 [Clostridia bacterium]|nr:hypothetical protein [Clostridia bacterium]
MERKMKFLSFWSINDGVRAEPLCRQMDQMRAHGIEGVVYHPRFYPGDPGYMTEEFIRVTAEVIFHAKSIGMEFWLYDENGWPSGSADGQVLKIHPDSKRWGLACVKAKDLQKDDRILCRHGEEAIVARGETGISPLCRATTDTFLSLTHERYAKELPKEAFDYVTGFFCDEVDYFPGHLLSEGAVPWCEEFEEFYIEKYGVSPCDGLWKLFDRAEEHEEYKIRFWETAGDLIARNFYRPYLDWCERHGKLFTGHLKGEESPYFQLMFSGSCFTQLKWLSLPAIDTLERNHGNHFFPYLLSSVAAQNGRSGCLAEAMGGAGWGVAPDDVKQYMIWLAEAGVERVVLHLSQFRLKARAIRDWPPSVPLHLSWSGAFADLLSDIRETTSPILQAAWEAPKLLIVTPTRGIMASYRPHGASAVNLHDGSDIPEGKSESINAAFLETVENCYAQGLRYHFTEERELKGAYLRDGRLHLGAMAYEKVMIPEGCRFEPEEQALIDEMRALGMLLPSPEKAEETAEKPTRAHILPEQSAWIPNFPMQNQFLIEWRAMPDGKLCASVDMKRMGASVTLAFSDPIADLRTNAARTVRESETRFSLFGLSEKLILDVTPAPAEALPFAWLKGTFSVLSEDGWRAFEENQVICKGRFILDGSGERKQLRAGELVSQGLPFFEGLLTAQKYFVLKEAFVGELDFEGLSVTAARVILDGKPIGWWWKHRTLAVTLTEGEHLLTVEAAPSTYNAYGPHRYYLGDFRLTSPDTFFGRGGYTDNPDAPAYTLTDSMHFVKFTVDGTIVLRTGDHHV